MLALTLRDRFAGLLRLLMLASALLLSLTWQPALAAAWKTSGPYGGISNILVVDPQTPATLYEAGPFAGVFKSLDGGAHWARASTGLTDPTVRTLVIDPLNPQTLYAAGGNGIFKSSDGAASWTQVNPLVNVVSLAIDPKTPSKLYAVVNQGPVYKSTDSGQTWTSLFSVLPSQSVYVVAVDPKTPANLYAGAQGGLWKSTNSGASWTLITNGLGTGFIIVQYLFVDPARPATLFGQSALGWERSTDGGLTWSVMSGVPLPLVFSMLAVDPAHPAILYGATYPGNLYISTNTGDTWTGLGDITAGFAGYVHTLAVDPTNGSNLYAATDRGVFASADRGVTWAEANTGLANMLVTTLAADPLHPTVLYAGTEQSGIFKSTNSGNTWQRINDGWIDKVSGLLVDPLTPSRIYYGSSYGKGVFKSTDSGKTWNNVLPTLTVLALALDRAKPTTLYAVGGSNIVSKSLDAGKIWKAAAGGLSGLVSQPTGMSAIANVLMLSDASNGAFISTNGGVKWVADNPQVPVMKTPSGNRSSAPMQVNNDGTVTLYSFDDINYTITLSVESLAEINKTLGYLGDYKKLAPSGPPVIVWSPWAAPTGVAAADCPPISAIAIDAVTPTTFYAGGLCGVLKGTNNGAQLAKLGNGLPENIQVQALATSSDGKYLFAGLMGGGVFRFTLP